MLHAHIDRTATDCDGRLDQSYVVTMLDSEVENQFGDIEFHNRVVAQFVNTYSILSTGSLEVTRLDVGTHDVKFEWSEGTEEGYVMVTGRFCIDECDDSEFSQRDHTAEAMGY
jgi:hypothetical protein